METSKYTVAELVLAAPRAFKVSSAVAAGAFHDVTEPITRAEAEQRIKAFTGKVIHAPGEPVPTPAPAVQAVPEEAQKKSTSRTKKNVEGAGQ